MSIAFERRNIEFGDSARIHQMAHHEQRWLAMTITRKAVVKDGGIRLDCVVRFYDNWSYSSLFPTYPSCFILPVVSGRERSCMYLLKQNSCWCFAVWWQYCWCPLSSIDSCLYYVLGCPFPRNRAIIIVKCVTKMYQIAILVFLYSIRSRSHLSTVTAWAASSPRGYDSDSRRSALIWKC